MMLKGFRLAAGALIVATVLMAPRAGAGGGLPHYKQQYIPIVAPGEYIQVDVICKRGWYASGGGFSVNPDGAMYVNQSVPLPSQSGHRSRGWMAGVRNTGTTNHDFGVYAVCVPNP